MSKKLENKIAVITGGSSGIGLATAKTFVEEGAYVFITGRRKSELDKALVEIGKNVSAIQGDVTSLQDLERLYATVENEKGKIDILVINAGFVEHATLATATPEHFDKTFNVNVRGVFFTASKALPLLRNGGSVVLVSSAGHLKGVPTYTVYSAAKAAMRSFARTWAAELKDRSIRVNSLSPGPVETPFIDAQFQTKQAADHMRSMFTQIIPMGRMGTAQEMAAAVLFLASNDSSFCTGIDLVADGGSTQI